jgi:hypothetical protein
MFFKIFLQHNFFEFALLIELLLRRSGGGRSILLRKVQKTGLRENNILSIGKYKNLKNYKYKVLLNFCVKIYRVLLNTPKK